MTSPLPDRPRPASARPAEAGYAASRSALRTEKGVFAMRLNNIPTLLVVIPAAILAVLLLALWPLL